MDFNQLFPVFLSQMEELSALTPILSFPHNSEKLVSSRLKPDMGIDKTSQIGNSLFIFYCTIRHHYKHYIAIRLCYSQIRTTNENSQIKLEQMP